MVVTLLRENVVAQVDDLRSSIRITGLYNRNDIFSRSAIAPRPLQENYDNHSGLSEVQEERRSIELSRQNSLM